MHTNLTVQHNLASRNSVARLPEDLYRFCQQRRCSSTRLNTSACPKVAVHSQDSDQSAATKLLDRFWRVRHLELQVCGDL